MVKAFRCTLPTLFFSMWLTVEFPPAVPTPVVQHRRQVPSLDADPILPSALRAPERAGVEEVADELVTGGRVQQIHDQ
jgi:hypothetical protein